MLEVRSLFSLPPATSSSSAGAQWIVSSSESEWQLHWEAVRWPGQPGFFPFYPVMSLLFLGCGLCQKGRGCLHPSTPTSPKLHQVPISRYKNYWMSGASITISWWGLKPSDNKPCAQVPAPPSPPSVNNNSCPTCLGGSEKQMVVFTDTLKMCKMQWLFNHEIFQGNIGNKVASPCVSYIILSCLYAMFASDLCTPAPLPLLQAL